MRRSLLSLMGAAALVLALASPAAAAGPGGGQGGGGQGGGGGNGGSSGSTTGSEYADLNVVLRATDGTPVLQKYVIPASSENPETTEYCPQPVSYSAIPGVTGSTTNPVDGQQVWVVPLMGQLIGSAAFTESSSACDPQPQYAMFVTPTDLARLNLARTTESVLAQKLADVTAKLQVAENIALESTGRISVDGTPIDAAPENAAIYQALMTTGTIPGLPASMAGPPATVPAQPVAGNPNSQFNAWDLAAMALGATADKKTPLSVDAVEYYNRIIGLPALYQAAAANPSWKVNFITSTYPGSAAPADAEQFVDYSGFSYNRSQTFNGSVTWLDTATLHWTVSKILDVVPWHNMSPDSSTGTLHGILAFAQMADDVRALCDFIPDNTFIPGFYMDVPGVDTYTAQVNAITNPAVDLGILPASAFQSYPFQMTASLFNPFGSDQIPATTIPDARLRVSIHAPGALKEGDVTATEVPATVGTEGQSVPFTVSSGDLTGWWGPEAGFVVGPGYHVSTTFNVTVADSAPPGDYQLTLDLVTASDPSKVLASDTGTITVLPDRATILWGSPLPQLATQDTYMAIPVQIYSPAAEGAARVKLSATGPGSLTAGDLTVYADNGTDMAPMTLTADASGGLAGTWEVALGEGNTPGYTTVIWYAKVAAGAPVGAYTFGATLEDGNTLEPIVVSVAAPESHGQKPPNAGGETTAPVVTVTANGTLGATASFTLSADQNGVTYSCQLTVNGVAGPTEACEKNVKYEGLLPGDYILSVVGTNTAGIASDPVVVPWTVPETPPAPGTSVAITSAGSATFTPGQPSTFSVTATGSTTPRLSAVGGLPSGVTFIDNGDGTATLGGVPSLGTDGTYTFTVVATTGSVTTEQTFHLTVAPTPKAAPAITSGAGATFPVGQFASFTVTTSGWPIPALSLSPSSAGQLPQGVTFTDNDNGTATLAGTPAVGSGGAYTLEVTASNKVLPDAVQAFTLTVQSYVPPTPPPSSGTGVTFTSAGSTTFTPGHAGTFEVTATGTPTPTLSYRGTLPPGVTFTDNGDGTATLAGTPADGSDGVYSFTVVATTGTVTTDQTFRLTVASTPPVAPRITSAAGTTFVLGQPGRFTVTATGSPTPHLSVSGALPAGVTFADNGNGQGTLAGTPTAVGPYPLTFTAANGVLPNATQSFALTVTPSEAAVPPGVEPEGYWLVGSDGGIFTFGPRISFYGSTGNVALNKPIVGMAATPGGHGYWLVASDGGVFAFGDARFYGSTGNMALTKPIVGMAATHDGHGYWLVASDGGVFAFGDAGFYGSTGNIALTRPIVGMAATPGGHGYWLVGSDGGVFSFGDARFFGSTGNVGLNKPIVGIASPDAKGYWLVASDGGIFAFGDAPFYGSTGAMTLNKPIVGMAENPATGGYWMVASDGGVFSFHTPFYGSTGAMTLDKPIVGMASAA